MPKAVKIGAMLSAVDATGTGATFSNVWSGEKCFQAVVSGTGAVSSTVLVQGSLDPATLGWVTIGTITLDGTTTTTDGFVSEGVWPYLKGNVTTLSGTGAAVTLKVAEE